MRKDGCHGEDGKKREWSRMRGNEGGEIRGASPALLNSPGCRGARIVTAPAAK